MKSKGKTAETKASNESAAAASGVVVVLRSAASGKTLRLLPKLRLCKLYCAKLVFVCVMVRMP